MRVPARCSAVTPISLIPHSLVFPHSLTALRGFALNNRLGMMNKTRNELLEEILANINGGGGGISSMQIVEVTTTYTVLTSDDVVLGSGGSPITFNLPPVSSAVKLVILKNMSGGSDITIDPSGSELIEGLSTQVLNADESMTLAPSSTNDWVIV